MAARFDVLIVGAGQAGAQTAISLRQAGFAGSIALLGDEPDPPYERPPLSKDYLAGERTPERLLLRPPDFWPQRRIELLLGRRVESVDAAAREVRTSDGEAIGYGQLVWAAGGKPRPLPVPGADLAGVHVIRTRQDVDGLRAELGGASTVVIVGGGYIGLETAAILTKAGKRVVLLEALDRVLARVAGEELSRFYERQHRAAGVELHLRATVSEVVGADGRVAGVRMADGSEIRCELVIVGIGIIPSVAPLVGAGAEGRNGVDVDEYCRTSLAHVYAIGDCAHHFNRYAEGWIRLESVQNAVDQAKVAAAGILGDPQPYAAVPWFWSNQYDLRLQTVGVSAGYDSTVIRGDPADRSFSLVYLKRGRVIALDCVNAAKDYVQGKALIERGLVVDPAMLADPGVPLKSLLPAAA